MLESHRGAGASYVERTDRPKIGEVEIATAAKSLKFSKVREAWDKLSAEDQEKYMLEGNWQLEPQAEAAKKKARTH